MPRLQVTCVNKTDRYEPAERIGSIGGAGWKQTEKEAIDYIERGIHSYYIDSGGYAVDVLVMTRSERKYLKTENDSEQPNNLLALPECPP
jgi:hypothetical protein